MNFGKGEKVVGVVGLEAWPECLGQTEQGQQVRALRDQEMGERARASWARLALVLGCPEPPRVPMGARTRQQSTTTA